MLELVTASRLTWGNKMGIQIFLHLLGLPALNGNAVLGPVFLLHGKEWVRSVRRQGYLQVRELFWLLQEMQTIQSDTGATEAVALAMAEAEAEAEAEAVA